MNSVIDLLAMDGYLLRSLNPQLDPIAFDVYHHDGDVITNHDVFVFLPRQN